MKSALILSLMLLATVVKAQRVIDVKAMSKKEALAEAKRNRVWHNGRIVLQDSTQIKGLVKYDFLKNYASIMIGEEILAFNEKGILYFEYFDESKNHTKKFCSLSFEGKVLLFEVLAEFKQFNLLSHRDVVTYYQENLGNATIGTNDPDAGYQRELVVILDQTGEIIPYINTKLRKKVLKEYFNDEAYQAMWSYASKNKLKFENASDFTKIVEANRHYFD